MSVMSHLRILSETLRAFLGDETGATAIEYGLILAFVILGIIVTIGLIGEDVLAIFTVDEQAFE